MKTEIQARGKHRVVNGVRLHYREWGSADAPPLLILHGLTGHVWEFDRVASTLADRFRVLAVNQRGHGASSWADAYSPESWQTMWPHSSTHWTSAACGSSVTRWEASTVDG